MITVKDFLAYVEETTRDQLWIDHDADYFNDDVYIAAGVSTSYPSYYEFYIRNAKVERLYSAQEEILELWTVDPKVTKPFYLSENTIRFVTDDNDYPDPRKTELIFTGDEIFVTACDFPLMGCRLEWQFPQDLPARKVEEATRFQKLIFDDTVPDWPQEPGRKPAATTLHYYCVPAHDIERLDKRKGWPLVVETHDWLDASGYPHMSITNNYWVMLALLWRSEALVDAVRGWWAWNEWVSRNRSDYVPKLVQELDALDTTPLASNKWAMDTFCQLREFYRAAAARGEGVIIIGELQR